MNIMEKVRALALVLWVGLPMATGCGGSKTPNALGEAGVQGGSAGAAGPGGQTVTRGGTAGSPAGAVTGSSASSGGLMSGGTSTSGGSVRESGGVSGGNIQTGGSVGMGGSAGSGGASVTGGSFATGGTTVVGGTIVAGGSTVAGGTTLAGGATVAAGIAARGGSSASGGATARGGSTAAGGTFATGGSVATGGAAATGWVTIHNDFFWYDNTGTEILTRAGCLRNFAGVYYWYGLLHWQDKNGWNDQTCYTSTDLIHWTYKGIVFHSDVGVNRMDVLYNDTSKKYVMFMKYGGNAANLGIATASTPDGQFTFLSQTLVDGAAIGDMSVYEDDDGKAYLAYVWDGTGPNRQHGIYRMSADYLSLDTRMYLWSVASREAPHIFKRNGTYYYGVSETNGVDPSPTRYYAATNLTGPWSAATMLVTPGSSTTYETQCDFVFPFAGTQGTVYMLDADRWLPTGGFQGGYLWLPYEFSATGAPTANYYQDWDLNPAAGTWREFDRTTRDLALGKTATASSTNGANAASNVTKATTYQDYTASRWESTASDPQTIMVDLGSAMEINRVILKWYSNYGKAFKVQVSADSTTWTDVFSTTVGASYSVTDEKFAKTTARYVRMNGTQRGNANGYSLFAFMVLNDP
jgi:hypothetical protein